MANHFMHSDRASVGRTGLHIYCQAYADQCDLLMVSYIGVTLLAIVRHVSTITAI